MPKLNGSLDSRDWLEIVACFVTLLLSAPFLWAIFVGTWSTNPQYKEEMLHQLQRLQIGIILARFIIGSMLISFIVSQFISVLAISGIFVAFIGIGAIFFSRLSAPVYKKIEDRFIAHINQSDSLVIVNNAAKELAPWDATLAEFTVSSYSSIAAKTLQQSGLKEKFGITVAIIERGGRRILSPTRDEMLLPADKLFLIGVDESLVKAREVIEAKAIEEMPPLSESYGLISLTLLSTDSFVNKTIRECGIREAVQGLIVGIERNGERYLSPDSSMRLFPKDLVWIVGDKALIKSLRGNLSV